MALTAYVWSKRVGRYFRRSDGRLVPPSEIEKEIDRLVMRTERQMLALGEELDAETITLRQWQNEMRRLITSLNTATGSASRGGLRNLDEAARQTIQAFNKEQLAYLRNFALKIQAGHVEPGTGDFTRRIRGYARAGRNGYFDSQADWFLMRGHARARRLLRPAEHCTTLDRSGCVELANLGYVPIAELVKIGNAQCLYNCHCAIEFEGAPTRDDLQREAARVKRRLGIE